MGTALTVVHILLSIALVGLVLMQHGKGADAGAAFGAGASGTVFGSRGSANFLSRTTAILAMGFFVTSLALAWFSMRQSEPVSLIEKVGIQQPAAAKPEEPMASQAKPAPADMPSVNNEAAPAAAAAPDLPVVSDKPAGPAVDNGAVNPAQQ